MKIDDIFDQIVKFRMLIKNVKKWSIFKNDQKGQSVKNDRASPQLLTIGVFSF